MKIGIIGAGNIGATLAQKLAACGHEIKLANFKGPESIAELANTLGVVAASKGDAVQNVSAIIISIPFAKIPDLASLFSNVPPEVVVIDTSNYYPFRDGAIAEVDSGKPESVWVSEQINRPVVKAWNAVLATTLAEKGRPKGASGRIAVPVAGDNLTNKNTAMGLVNETGFDAFDSGSLRASWRQQPGTAAYCTELTAVELKSALQRADQLHAPSTRDAILKEAIAANGKLSHEQIVALNRAATA